MTVDPDPGAALLLPVGDNEPGRAVGSCADGEGQPYPMVTIITAVFNAADTIEKSLRSTLDQSYPNKELIVIDGASTDGTIEILSKYSDRIAYWKSEPDSGIYHAWNKALPRARGEWICFLGADDYWIGPHGLGALVAAAQRQNLDLLCGKVVVVDSSGAALRLMGAAWDWRKVKRWLPIAHQATLHSRSLFDRFGQFDERYQIAGDYEFLLRLGADAKAGFLDEAVICMGANGKSRTDVPTVLREAQEIQARHKEIGPVRAAGNYYWAMAKWLFRRARRKY